MSNCMRSQTIQVKSWRSNYTSGKIQFDRHELLSNFKGEIENIHKVEIARSRVNELAKGNAYVHQSGGGGNSIDSSTPTPSAWPKFIHAKLYKLKCVKLNNWKISNVERQ